MGDMQDSGRGHGPRPDDLDGDPFAELARLVDEPWTGNPAGAQYHASDADVQVPAFSDEHWAQEPNDHGFSPEEAWGEDFAGDGEEFSAMAAATTDEDALSLEDAFADAFAEEIHADPVESDGAGSGEAVRPAVSAVPVVASSYSNWIAPRGGAQQRVQAVRPAVPEEFDQALESELETALRGLSAPANPRGTVLHHAQSFAPARIEMEEPAQAPSLSPSHAIDDFDKLIESELAVMTVQGGFSGKERRVHAAPASAGVQPFSAGPAVHAAAASVEDDVDDVDAAAAGGRLAVLSSRASGSPFLGRRAVALGSSVMALALFGALGAFVWGGSGTEGIAAGEEVLLVKADPDPVKIVPDDPGGRDIPNQNKAVYERVQSPAPAAPTQETLLTTADEPIDVPDEAEFRSVDPLPGVELADAGEIGQEARLAEVDDGSPIPVLQPRRVRTVKVRADGTLVLDPPAVPETSMADLRSADVALTETASRPIDLAAADSDVAAEIASISNVVGSTGSVEPALRPDPVALTPTPQASPAADPAAATVDVARAYAPVETPVTPAATAASSVGGAEGPVEATASVDPNGYFVQISSQPSEVLAKDALQTLGARYSGLIGRRPMVIQPADIPGRGTYYRVRVATSSKDEASRLCDELKLAGGSCFVAR